MTGAVRVLVYHDTEDESAILAAYHEASANLADVPGLLGNELLRSPQLPTKYVVASYWSSFEAFREWESGPGHRADTAPLRQYQDRSLPSPYGVYRVDACYGAGAPGRSEG